MPGLKPKWSSIFPHTGGTNTDLRPVLVIRVVTVRNYRVEAVIAAGEFKHDQDPFLVARFGLPASRAASSKEGGTGDQPEPPYPNAVKTRLQNLSTFQFHGIPQLN